MAEQRAGVSAFLEAGHKLATSRPSWMQPDVSVILRSRVDSSAPEGYFSGAPELAIEVVSPSESAADLERKVELMIEHGSREVWVIFPRPQKVRVYRRDGSAAILGVGEVLTFPALLPEWEFPVAKLFED